jgi:hypothetical protein
VARLIGKKPSTVQAWANKGIIPAKWQSELLKIAQEKSIDLNSSDFMEMRPDASLVAEVLPPLPKATNWGELHIGDDITIPCYVLDNGERVFSLKGVVVGLIGTEGVQLPEYLKVSGLQDSLPLDLKPDSEGSIPALFRFDTTASGIAKIALGLSVEKFMDLCSAYSSAEDNDQLKTDRQKEIAKTANRLLRACSKVGIIALVDEATGYQYERVRDASDFLQFKLKAFLSEEMRPWEKTFPDELWQEFGRLTNWSGPVTSRPKWWGKLVIELVYEYLDADVAKWLRENAPKPRHGQNYFQWLNAQYGLKKLVEHIWMLIGLSRACFNLDELRERMAIQYGRQRVQLSLFLPPPPRKIN